MLVIVEEVEEVTETTGRQIPSTHQRPATDWYDITPTTTTTLQQQQGMLKTVLAHMEEQQKLMLEKQHKLEKKLNSLEESTPSSGSDGHKQKARVTRQLTVSNFFFIQFMCTSSHLQNLVAAAYDAFQDDFYVLCVCIVCVCIVCVYVLCVVCALCVLCIVCAVIKKCSIIKKEPARTQYV